MKKVLYVAIAIFASSLFAFGSQRANVCDNPTEIQADTAIGGVINLDCANYSFSYSDLFDGEENVLGFYATSEDGATLSVAFNETGPTVEQLEEAARNWAYMMEANDETVVSSKVDGNILTIRSTQDGMVKDFYIVVGQGTKGVSGTMTYPEDKATVYGPLFQPMLKSFIIK